MSKSDRGRCAHGRIYCWQVCERWPWKVNSATWPCANTKCSVTAAESRANFPIPLRPTPIPEPENITALVAPAAPSQSTPTTAHTAHHRPQSPPAPSQRQPSPPAGAPPAHNILRSQSSPYRPWQPTACSMRLCSRSDTTAYTAAASSRACTDQPPHGPKAPSGPDPDAQTRR